MTTTARAAGPDGRGRMTLTVGSLFSGVGGFDLGFERASMRCLWQCEIDAAARSVLTRHWPSVTKHTDVRAIGAHNLEPVDVICGGFPCQDLSVAGSRAGLAGERSGLWHEFHRVLTELRPRWCVIENVPGLLSSNRGRDFAIILRGLVECGYGVTWRVLDAQYFGLAQRRRRVFIVGSLGNGRSAEILFEPESVPGHPPTRRAQGQDVAGTLGGSSQSGGFRTTDLDNNGAFVPVARSQTSREGSRLDGESCTFVPMGFDNKHTKVSPVTESLRAGSHGALPMVAQSVALRGRDGGATAELGGEVATALRASQGGGDKPHVLAFTSKDYGGDAGELSPTLRSLNFDKSHMNGGGQIAVAGPMAVRRLTPRECERLQGFPDDWTAGQADSSRYRQLGNAVAVPVAEWIGRRIVEATNAS